MSRHFEFYFYQVLTVRLVVCLHVCAIYRQGENDPSALYSREYISQKALEKNLRLSGRRSREVSIVVVAELSLYQQLYYIII